MAIGSTEEHGRHNPLGTDTLAPNLLLDKIEAALGKDVLIAPTIPFGNADDLLGFPGTLSIGYDLLRSLVRTLSMQLYDYGARRFLFINGHGPNIKPISSVCEELNRRGCLAARADWWLMAGELNPAWRGGHGGAEETAAVMAVDPRLGGCLEIGPMASRTTSRTSSPPPDGTTLSLRARTLRFPAMPAATPATAGWVLMTQCLLIRSGEAR